MIRIVTDSTAYLTKQEADHLSAVVVPINYLVNRQSFGETYVDQNGDFEEKLRQETELSTSQPNMLSFVSAFEDELAAGNQVLCITISSRLSGTYSAACMAAKQVGNADITVFDSRSTAGGLYLLLVQAKELIDQGYLIGDIAERLKKTSKAITVSFTVDDLTPLRRSGRIGFVRSGIRTILNIRPILLCKDGAVIFDSVARGNEQAVQKLIAKTPVSVKEIVINYIDNTSMADQLYSAAKKKHPDIPIKMQKMGPVLGIHLGLQVIGFSFII